MGTDTRGFAKVVRGGATGSHVTGSDVSHVTGSDVTGSVPYRKWRQSRARNRKYVMRMRNKKLRNIHLFWPEVTSVKRPEEALSGSVRMRNRKLCNRFPRFFSYCSTSTMDTEGHPKGVRMRNRKLRNRFPRFFLTIVVGVFSTTSASSRGYPGYLPLSRHFIFISYMYCVVLQVFLLYITIVVQGVFSTTSASSPGYLPLSRDFHFTGSHFIFI